MLVDMNAVARWIVVSFSSINLGHRFRGGRSERYVSRHEYCPPMHGRLLSL
jgi:hypothetical protein